MLFTGLDVARVPITTTSPAHPPKSPTPNRPTAQTPNRRPQVFWSMLFTGLDVACVSITIALHDTMYVARSFVLTLAVVWASMWACRCDHGGWGPGVPGLDLGPVYGVWGRGSRWPRVISP